MLKLLIDAYKNGEVDTIEIAYPSFVNVLVQEPIIQSLLPIVDLREVLEQLKKHVSETPSLEARVVIPAKWFLNHLRKLFLMHCPSFT